MTTNNTNIRTIVRGCYDLQKLRIMMGNRIVAQFKAKLGQEPSTTEEETIDEEGQEMLVDLRKEFKTMMDGVKTVKLATFKATPLISTFTEFCLMQQFMDLEESEKRHFANLGKILLDYPIFTEYLNTIKGIGPAMAGVIVSEIDIGKAKYVSSIWAYAGLDVAQDGNGRSRKKEHLVERAYTNSEGEAATRVGITFNPFLKTKLIGVLGSSFLRSKNDPYSGIYANYKHRLESHPKWADRSKGHRHNAAIRYMVKCFLIDLYSNWKRIEGLPAERPYHEAKLGMKHGHGQSG